MSKKTSEEKAEVQHPRTSGGPEAFAGPITPATEADRKASLEHAQAMLARQAKLSPPEQMHSMRRVEMQAHGISDEALQAADDLGISRERLLASPEIAAKLDELNEVIREAAAKG